MSMIEQLARIGDDAEARAGAVSTLAEYASVGSQVYRTDTDGKLVVSVQDQGVVVTTG